MTTSGEGPAAHSKVVRLAALGAVVVAIAGVPAQAAFVARTAATQLTAPHEHRIRALLVAAAKRIPDGARYAVTSAARTPNAVYFIRQAKVVPLRLKGPPTAVRARLAEHRVRFVIVLYRNHAPAFASPASTWYHVLLKREAGELVEIDVE
jgi:hypothetical protein